MRPPYFKCAKNIVRYHLKWLFKAIYLFHPGVEYELFVVLRLFRFSTPYTSHSTIPNLTFYIVCIKCKLYAYIHYMEYKMKRSTGTPRIAGFRLIRTLSANEKDIFTIADAQKITQTRPTATRMLLSDLTKKKWLIRLTPGHYLIVPLSAGEQAEFSENWYVIAKYLIEPNPYYLSHYSALDIHEMTTQPLMTIYVTATKRRENKEILGANYRFIYANSSKSWGIEEIWVKPTEKVKVSDLERTIIDCLDNPKLCGGISEIAKGLWRKKNEIDYTKLVKYVDRFDSKAVAKRLGFLLELYNIGDKAIPKLRKFVTPTFVLLDPSLPAKGKHQSSWRLKVNLNPDELKDIIKT